MSENSQNPFMYEAYGTLVGTMNAEDRIHELSRFGVEKLRQVIALPGVQRTVKRAAEQRLKKLVKQKNT